MAKPSHGKVFLNKMRIMMCFEQLEVGENLVAKFACKKKLIEDGNNGGHGD